MDIFYQNISLCSDQQLSDEMVLETAETLLALSGKSKPSDNDTSTAIVLPQQPPQSPLKKGKTFKPFLLIQYRQKSSLA